MKKLVSALLLGAGVASGVSAYAAVPAGYETEGLIACWDAIDNQGTGTQDKSATTWVDLVGGVTFDLAGATWKDFSLSLSGSSSGGVATGATFLNYTAENKNRTVEIVAKFPGAPSAAQLLLMGTSSSTIGIGRTRDASGTMCATCGSNSKMLNSCPIDAVTTISYGYSSGAPQSDHLYHDATAAVQTTANDNWGGSDSNVYLGKRSTGNSFKGEIFAVRVYDRLLTADEVAANRAADVIRFGYALAATVSAGSVTVSDPAVVIGGNLYVPEGTAALPIASAADATIQIKGVVKSLSIASGTLALESTCAGRLKLDALELGANVVLQLPKMGMRVGTTLTAEAGAVVKGPGKLYGPPATCPAALEDGAEYASLTAKDKYGYVDGGELIAYWDAIDNKATGTHGTGKSWVDLIGGKQFTWSAGPSWQDKSLRFSGSSGIDLGVSDTFMNFVSGDTARTVEIAFKSSADSDGVMVLFLGSANSKIAITRYNAGVRATIGTAKLYPAITDGAFSGISYGYVSGVPQEDCTYHDGEIVAQGEESPAEMKYIASDVRVGFRSGYNDGYLFKGDIYAVRVYDRLLTADEVAKNRQNDVDRFTMHAAATVKAGTVTVGGRTFAAGETVMVPVEETGTLVVESAADADIVLEPGFAELEVASGSLALTAAEEGEGVQLTSLTLGEDVVLKLPAAGLTVFGSITADPTAAVAGPGELAGSAATSPVTLTDGASYYPLGSAPAWTGWPSSGTAYVPADTTAPIAADDVAKVAALDRIVLLGETSKVTYGLADAWTLTTPFAGRGTVEFADAGKIVILSDNRDLLGAFYFTNTTCVVSNEFGLGSSASQTCHFWCGDARTLDFGNGTPVFTNHVALYLHPLAKKNITFGSQSMDETLVQAAAFDTGRYNTNQDGFSPNFKNNVTFLELVVFNLPSGSSSYLYPGGTKGGHVNFMKGFKQPFTVYASGSGIYYYFGAPLQMTSAFRAYSGWISVCGCEDVFSTCSEYTYQQLGSTLDLNGYDQCIKSLGAGSDMTKINFHITSATPAQLISTGNADKYYNPDFQGAAGYTKRGTGTHRLSTTVCETTGRLAVEAGTLELAEGYSWRGTNVVVSGGALVVSSDLAFPNGKANLLVTGGTFAVKKGGVALFETATFGAVTLPDATYTMAALKAMDGVGAYIGAAADDAATITVKKAGSGGEWAGWPEEGGDVTIPGGATATVTEDDLERFAKVTSIDIENTAELRFSGLTDPIALAMPISGMGKILFENCGTVVITADNSGLTAPGCFSFTMTDVVVSNRYGLGSAQTATCSFYVSDTILGKDMRKMTFMGSGQTNDVAITFDHGIIYQYDDPSVDENWRMVQNGTITMTDGFTTERRGYFRKGAVFNADVIGHYFEFKGIYEFHANHGSPTDTAWNFGVGYTLDYYGPAGSIVMNQFTLQNDWTINLRVPYQFNNRGGFAPYNGCLVEMNGNSQQLGYLHGSNGQFGERSAPIDFHSEEPAELFLYNKKPTAGTGHPDEPRSAAKFTGAVSLRFNGEITQWLGGGASDTTGSLTIEKGRLEFTYGSYWGGTNVVVSGGTLAIAASASTNKVTGAGTFFNRKALLQVSGTGAVDIAAGRTETVKCYGIDGEWQPAGTYTLGAGKLRVRRNSPDEGILILVR